MLIIDIKWGIKTTSGFPTNKFRIQPPNHSATVTLSISKIGSKPDFSLKAHSTHTYTYGSACGIYLNFFQSNSGAKCVYAVSNYLTFYGIGLEIWLYVVEMVSKKQIFVNRNSDDFV